MDYVFKILVKLQIIKDFKANMAHNKQKSRWRAWRIFNVLKKKKKTNYPCNIQNFFPVLIFTSFWGGVGRGLHTACVNTTRTHTHTHVGVSGGSSSFFPPPESCSIMTRKPSRAPRWSPLPRDVCDLSCC